MLKFYSFWYNTTDIFVGCKNKSAFDGFAMVLVWLINC